MANLKFKNIIFDFDSTLTVIEGLDAIAKKKNILRAVKKITAMGMNGHLPFSQSIRMRLEIIKPTEEDFTWLTKQYRQFLLTDTKQTINRLKNIGIEVYLLSGGPRPAVEPIALEIGFKHENIWASCLRKNQHGYYQADDSCVMTLDEGKVKITQQIRQTGPTVVVGDGMTDYQAGLVADQFIGFGGIVKRETLKKITKFYIDEPKIGAIFSYL